MANTDIPFLLTLGKLETQTLGGLVIWNFSVWSILNKWQPFFNFFTMADADIQFPLTLRNPETQTLVGLVTNLNFFHMIDIKEMAAIFQFFHNGWHWYSINTGKTGHVNFLLVQFSKFSVGSVFPVTHPRFHYNINVWLHLKHFCVVTFLYSENWRHKFSIDSVFQTFPLVQFSLSPISGSVSTFMHGYA